jgi:sugar phosphate isomerase/epimerase
MALYATSTWCWTTDDISVADVVEEFVGYGYNAMSFSTAHLKSQLETEVHRAAELVGEHDLPVTFHGNIGIGFDQVVDYIHLFGDNVECVTFDASMRKQPQGTLYDTGLMAPFMERLLEATAGTNIRIGVEDFPLDHTAVDFYSDDLGALIDDPRYGMLIDVGHMNMHLNSQRYFEGISVAEYFQALPVPVVELHLHDNDGYRDQHGWFGMGTLDFAEVARAAESVGFEGVSTIEIAPGLHESNPVDDRPHARTTLDEWKHMWPGAGAAGE